MSRKNNSKNRNNSRKSKKSKLRSKQRRSAYIAKKKRERREATLTRANIQIPNLDSVEPVNFIARKFNCTVTIDGKEQVISDQIKEISEGIEKKLERFNIDPITKICLNLNNCDITEDK